MEENTKFGYDENQGGADAGSTFCGNCGTKLLATQAFCPFCGYKVNKKAPAVEEPAYEAPAAEEPVFEIPAAEETNFETTVIAEPAYQAPTSDAGSTFCGNCGMKLSADQAFCPACGTKAPEKAPEANKSFCTNCGTEIKPGQSFCLACGQKVGVEFDAGSSSVNTQFNAGAAQFNTGAAQFNTGAAQFNADVNSAITQYNTGIETKKKKSKVLPAVIAVVLVVIIGVVAVLASSAAKKAKVEEAWENKEKYEAAATEFLDLYLDAGVNLEDIADRIEEYWYDSIWYDYYDGDINKAIAYALDDSEYELGLAEDYDAEMKSMYSYLKNIPDNIPEEYRWRLENICAAVKDAYEVYLDYYVFATDPSGSYNSFTADKEDYTDEYIDAYDALDASLLT